MKLESIKIREHNSDDFAGLARLHNLIMPELPTAKEEYRHWDEINLLGLVFGRIYNGNKFAKI